ncbi:uncharacterized protein V1510DRAFT_415933 [Dipodascopsis tothii]|uniref:uncharacterized protein n=1 Tax=Dipodascopsis tothii TaxID=44089 RepID=UPI0034CE5234
MACRCVGRGRMKRKTANVGAHATLMHYRSNLAAITVGDTEKTSQDIGPRHKRQPVVASSSHDIVASCSDCTTQRLSSKRLRASCLSRATVKFPRRWQSATPGSVFDKAARAAAGRAPPTEPIRPLYLALWPSAAGIFSFDRPAEQRLAMVWIDTALSIIQTVVTRWAILMAFLIAGPATMLVIYDVSLYTYRTADRLVKHLLRIFSPTLAEDYRKGQLEKRKVVHKQRYDIHDHPANRLYEPAETVKIELKEHKTRSSSEGKTVTVSYARSEITLRNRVAMPVQ